MKQKPIISSVSALENAVCDYLDYKPVKITPHLKEKFNRAITEECIERNITKWTGTITYLKKSAKYQRTKK